MKVLVWQWGRRGAGPLLAVVIARELARLDGIEPMLSLSTMAELLGSPHPPVNHLPIRTYRSIPQFARRLLAAPWLVPRLAAQLRAAQVDVALCAMPAPFDIVMAAALRRAAIPFAVMVHDAQRHPGDGFPLQMTLQRALLRQAGTLFALTRHVADQLRAQAHRHGQPITLATHPPFAFNPAPPHVRAHGGRMRLLTFGRLMPYKGLDLLADAMQRLPDPAAFELRVVGAGPESPDLDRLRALPGVTVENRWVPEVELGHLLGWADAVVLTHREASQSGVAAAAAVAGRWIVATRVGGLAEQLQAEPLAILCDPDAASIAAALATLPGREAPPHLPRPGWPSAITLAGDLRKLHDAARNLRP